MKRLLQTVLVLLTASCCRAESGDDYNLLRQKDGADLGFTSVGILKVRGHAYKDLNGNGRLDTYEDWKQSPARRAEHLASILPSSNPVFRLYGGSGAPVGRCSTGYGSLD